MIRRCHNRELYRSDKLRSHGTASSDTFTRRAKLASLPATGSLFDQDPFTGSKIINLYFKGLGADVVRNGVVRALISSAA